MNFTEVVGKKQVINRIRGRVENKSETYHHYRFALAFENMKNVKGYVSEKILDCLVSGIVPIYAGADDIADYVPEDCFIPYNRFKNPEEMMGYLKKIDKKQYQNIWMQFKIS